MGELLSGEEMQRWEAWKRATDAVWGQVVSEILAATGLSAADFSVLTRVVETDDLPRQQQLADALGWQRSRLSRQLTRMADRDLVERVGEGNERVVRATPNGRRAATAARAAHANAVRGALLTRTPRSSVNPFWSTIRDLTP